jgi:hypothetical protein
VEVVDMNGDGKKDIVALFAQGREGVYIFYQNDNLEFSVEQVIMMQPEYGSSWFSLLDYNNDGHLDILLANGDNADYSRYLKPYHGVRLFINEGDNKFNEEWFYPINGATCVLVEDFDIDGDVDVDIMLGNFSMLPANRFKSEKKYDLLFLENTVIKNQLP